METRGWLLLAAGEDRGYGGNDGYDDVPDAKYEWDSTVQRHAALREGDPVALRNKDWLLGVSVIERIETWEGTKLRRRCPRCASAKVAQRKRSSPPWRCTQCKNQFDHPADEMIEVRKYRSHHARAWVDLPGVMSAKQADRFSVAKNSILSLREVRWPEFVRALEDEGYGWPLPVGLTEQLSLTPNGHVERVTRVRLGQARFRADLMGRFGSVCAVTGDCPKAVLDAAHLYSYAELGQHRDSGGLLLRKDVHRLFDLGLIAVEPKQQTVSIAPPLDDYPVYARLQGQLIKVTLDVRHLEWLSIHWEQHRPDFAPARS